MLALQWNINVIWRSLLGVGAIPGLVVLYLRLGSGISTKKCKTDQDEKKKAKIVLESNCSNDLDGGEDTPPNHSSMMDEDRDTAALSNGSPTLEAAVSTLFSSDIPTSSSDGGGDAENELALVDNSHLENNENEDNKQMDRNTAAAAGSNEITMTPIQKKSPRGL